MPRAPRHHSCLDQRLPWHRAGALTSVASNDAHNSSSGAEPEVGSVGLEVVDGDACHGAVELSLQDGLQ